MPRGTEKRVVRIVGVGLDKEDEHIRITNGENFDIFLGSKGSHEQMQAWIVRIEEALKKQNRSLQEFTPEEFVEFVKSLD